jgi:hypothetical protein
MFACVAQETMVLEITDGMPEEDWVAMFNDLCITDSDSEGVPPLEYSFSDSESVEVPQLVLANSESEGELEIVHPDSDSEGVPELVLSDSETECGDLDHVYTCVVPQPTAIPAPAFPRIMPRMQTVTVAPLLFRGNVNCTVVCGHAAVAYLVKYIGS